MASKVFDSEAGILRLTKLCMVPHPVVMESSEANRGPDGLEGSHDIILEWPAR